VKRELQVLTSTSTTVSEEKRLVDGIAINIARLEDVDNQLKVK